LLRAAVSTQSFDEESFREDVPTGLSHLLETSEMTTGVVSNGGHISRARRYQLRHKQAGLCILCPVPAATKNHCARHAVAARERQRARMKFKRRNLRAASYSFLEDEQLIAKATTTVRRWMGVRPAVPAKRRSEGSMTSESGEIADRIAIGIYGKTGCAGAQQSGVL
jgi:hypothetical protein